MEPCFDEHSKKGTPCISLLKGEAASSNAAAILAAALGFSQRTRVLAVFTSVLAQEKLGQLSRPDSSLWKFRQSFEKLQIGHLAIGELPYGKCRLNVCRGSFMGGAVCILASVGFGPADWAFYLQFFGQAGFC